MRHRVRASASSARAGVFSTWRRRVVCLLVVFAAMPAWSFIGALRAPGSDSISARSVEWLRTHDLGGVVNGVEHWWYSHHPPPVGGTPKDGVPIVAPPEPAATRLAIHRTRITAVLPPPAPIVGPASPRLPREGSWQPTGELVRGHPAVYVTYLRPDNVHTSLLAGIAWFDPTLLKAVLVPGLTSPPHADRSWGAMVPVDNRAGLVAAFNSAFALNDARGGYYSNGHTYAPLRRGGASLAIRHDGTLTVGQWGRDVSFNDVSTARQNLDLIVDHGHLVPGLANNTNGRWGATVGNEVFVWRSGVGVTADGAIVYVGGPGLSVANLADLLVRARAVRAMELDINHEWVSCYVFDHDRARSRPITGSALVPGTVRSGDRYLKRGTRDFVALLART
jgi:hypothetical protein